MILPKHQRQLARASKGLPSAIQTLIKNFCRPPAVIVSYFGTHNTIAAQKTDTEDWLHEILFHCTTFVYPLKINRPKKDRDHSTYCFALIRPIDTVKVQLLQNICMKSVKIEKLAKGIKSRRYNALGKQGWPFDQWSYTLNLQVKSKLAKGKL